MAVLLEVNGVTKQFVGTRALDSVSLDVQSGEVHGLVGENGAGKSTLIKILSGAYTPDAGTIRFEGRAVQGWSPNQAREAGVVTIYQEFSLVPELSVAENIFLGRLPSAGVRGTVSYRKLNQAAREILGQLGLEIDPTVPVKQLGVAARQMVEIARAWSIRSKLVILDEPTAVLGLDDIARLHDLIRQLKQEGVGIIYVSHRLGEVVDLCDRVTVLKDGRLSGHLRREEFSPEKIVQLMIGRPVRDLKLGGHCTSRLVLQVEGLTALPKVAGVSFALHEGEILGIAGLVGSGRSEMARALFGIDPRQAGRILLDGQPVQVRSPQEAIHRGIGFLPEDRRQQALFLELPVRANITVGDLGRVSRLGWITSADRQVAADYAQQVRVKMPSLESPVAILSGGNQQKVVLARWLATRCRILVFDEPTRGVDVGSKEEIYRLIDDYVKQGGSTIVISSELPELLAISDRILVMARGRINGEFSREEASEAALMNKMVS
ncbi:MAG: sugar ABC transporter ATP-binding protein [Bacillota bacterium]|nr:sugar ABC transporter ATP-binding protein [Bacillota bacterium]